MRSQNVHILLSLLFQCHPNWISYFLLNLHLKDPENPWVRLKVSNGRLYVRSPRQTPLETEGEWRRAVRLCSALQFGTALDRSKSKLTIPIAAAAFAPSSSVLPTNCPSALGSGANSPAMDFPSHSSVHWILICSAFLPFLFSQHTEVMCRHLWLCRRHQTTPFSRCGRCRPHPTGSRVPLLVPSLISCISY